MIETSAREVVERFAMAPTAARELQNWSARIGQEHVVAHVMDHVTRALYSTTPEQVRRVCEETDHALGGAERRVAESVQAVRDWRPDFAMTHLCHYVFESCGQPFTWQYLVRVSGRDPTARAMFWDPAWAVRRRLEEDGVDPNVLRQAFRWRLGNAYYSFLRELYVLVALRARGVDARAHPLADAVFRVDGWVEHRVLQLYIKNSTYREDHTGRKLSPEALLNGPDSYFEVVPLKLAAPREYGHVHLPGEAQLDDIARLLQPGPSRAS